MARGGPDYSNIKEGGFLNVSAVTHAAQHQDGGFDEIYVGGLSGRLADFQSADRVNAGTDANLPTSPQTGDIYFATDTQRLYVYDGSNWVFQRYARNLRSGTLASRPGSGEYAGDVWFATDTGELYVWDGTAWVNISAGGGGAFTGSVDDFAKLYRNFGITIRDIVASAHWQQQKGTHAQINFVAGHVQLYVPDTYTENAEIWFNTGHWVVTQNNRYVFGIRLRAATSANASYFIGLLARGTALGATNPLNISEDHVAFIGHSGGWRCRTRASGSNTDTSITVTEGGAFEIEITSGGNAIFRIDGTQVANHTTNVPIDSNCRPRLNAISWGDGSTTIRMDLFQMFTYVAVPKTV